VRNGQRPNSSGSGRAGLLLFDIVDLFAPPAWARRSKFRAPESTVRSLHANGDGPPSDRQRLLASTELIRARLAGREVRR
jgi:hypothetical protein